jgi:hypothetical protein
MAKESPKQQPQQPEADPAPVKPKAQPITISKQQTLPPEAVKRRNKFKQDSHEIEWAIWRSING